MPAILVVRSSIPRATLVFVGREAELPRLEQSIASVPVSLLYGVAGVGKSALAYVAAARWNGTVAYRQIVEGESLNIAVDGARRALTHEPVVETLDADERIADLAEVLNRTSGMLVLDDLHRLALEDRRNLIGALCRLLRTGRLLATSRERIARDADSHDRFELRLSGLDVAAGRSLWMALDDLYGASAGFERAWARSNGSPLFLRRAHAGDLDENDPIAAAVCSLTSDERRVAGAIALAEVRLPTNLVMALLPRESSREVLRALSRRLIVDVDGESTCAMHDLFRDALRDHLTAAEREALHGELARLLQTADLDPTTRVREACRHLAALGRYEDVGLCLLAHATELVRQGAASELLHALDAIPPERRGLEVQVAHARTLGRLLDLRGAYEEFHVLVKSAATPNPDLLLRFGQIAMITGHITIAGRAFEQVLNDPELPSSSRLRVQIAFALLQTYQGQGSSARKRLQALAAETVTLAELGELLWCEAVTLWIDERSIEALLPLRRALGIFRQTPATLRTELLAPATGIAIFAACGCLEEAEQMERHAEAVLQRGTDPRTRVVLKSMRALLAYESGERAAAMAALESVADSFERGGDVLGELWARVWCGRLLLTIGQRKAALSLLNEIRGRARSLGAESVVCAVDRSEAFDPVAQIRARDGGPIVDGKRSEATRSRALATLFAACEGNVLEVRALLGANAEVAIGSDYAIDRALGHLALAVLARLEGDAEQATAAFEAAAGQAKDGGADLGLVETFDAALGKLRIVTPTARRCVLEPPPDLDEAVAVIDARSHRLRVGRRWVSLDRRPVLRRLLYVLADRPGRFVTKESVIERVWSAAYHPAIHDAALWANIRRLRTLLRNSNLGIDFGEDGYRLRVPEGFVYLSAIV